MRKWIIEHFYNGKHPKDAFFGSRNGKPLLVADFFNFIPNAALYFWYPMNSEGPFPNMEIVVEAPAGKDWTKNQLNFYNVTANELKEAFINDTKIDLINREPDAVDEEIKLVTNIP